MKKARKTIALKKPYFFITFIKHSSETYEVISTKLCSSKVYTIHALKKVLKTVPVLGEYSPLLNRKSKQALIKI